jgi:PEGA domain
MALAAIVALLMGAAGGALIFKLVQHTPPPAMVRVVIQSDRPADVELEGQVLGRTPVTAVFPVGHHMLQFREDGQPLRGYEIDVAAQSANTFSVRLDSLAVLP